MPGKQHSICPAGCRGGYHDRQGEYVLTHAELASLRGVAPSESWQAAAPVRRCTYCGCVYVLTDTPVVLGYKDFEPAGDVSWIPNRCATG